MQVYFKPVNEKQLGFAYFLRYNRSNIKDMSLDNTVNVKELCLEWNSLTREEQQDWRVSAKGWCD